MNIRALVSTATLATLLAGCATAPTPPIQQAPVAAPGATTAPALSLSAEQKRLAELFRGTPVVFEMTPEGAMRVKVPSEFCFDKGRSVVKPPLAKVLDKVAPSARSPGMKAKVLAPADNGHGGTIVQERAASARDYLVSRGVPVTHFSGLGPSNGDAIEIVVGKL